MAQIIVQHLKKVEKHRNNVHEKVFGTYTIFEENGEKYFQMDTYGKTEREMPEKISQSIQFNKENAKHLVNLLIREFEIQF